MNHCNRLSNTSTNQGKRLTKSRWTPLGWPLSKLWIWSFYNFILLTWSHSKYHSSINFSLNFCQIFMIFEQEMWKWQCYKSGCVLFCIRRCARVPPPVWLSVTKPLFWMWHFYTNIGGGTPLFISNHQPPRNLLLVDIIIPWLGNVMYVSPTTLTLIRPCDKCSTHSYLDQAVR